VSLHFSFAVNTILGSTLVIVLILTDYVQKYNTDSYQRVVFVHVLVFTLAGIAASFIYYLLEGMSGEGINLLFKMVLTFYYLLQSAAYGYVFVLIDYLSYKDVSRTKLAARAAWIMLVLHGFILTLNLRMGFYFYITDDNIFVRGDGYAVRLIIAFCPVLFTLLDLLIPSKSYKKSQFVILLLFIVFTGSGVFLDLVFKTNTKVWPCFTAALLYAYFFIIRSDSKLDSLTGIGNRYSFNEFINRISQQGMDQSWYMVMIDIDYFKQINDTLGHMEGDNALRDLASIIKGCIRHSDFAARYGGDEFIIAALADSDINRLLDRLHEAINIQNDKGSRPYKIEISYGQDIYNPDSGQSIEEFLAHIDRLMYQHKAERRRLRTETGLVKSAPLE
jgi:diguanylate cyclase (GGDEF)-like protein